jgi:DNA-binding response OmpR family regulator
MRHRLLQIAAATSVFAIALLVPFAHPSQADSPLPPGQCAYVEHYIVENDDAVRDFLVATLERAGLDAVGVGSAEAAIEFTFREPISGAIIDIGLPGLSGVGLVRALRQQATTAQVPLLVLTGEPHGQVEALDAGADDYLTKPVAVPELVARVMAQARAWGRPARALVDDEGNGGLV